VHQTHGLRLMRARGLPGQRPARPPRTTWSPPGAPRDRNLGPGLPLARPDQGWVADITDGRRPAACVSLAGLREVSTRRIRGWQLSRPVEQTLPVTALHRALVQHRPEMHHADHGAQSAATLSTHTRQALGGQLSMANVGEATEHGDAERRMRPMQEEAGRLHDDADCHAASQHRGRFLDDIYQPTRMHSA
jgi:putative transposase